jgi:hypothetical protein
MHDRDEPAHDRPGVIRAYQAELDKIIAIGTPQNVLDYLGIGLGNRIPQIPTNTWSEGSLDDVAAVLKKKSDGMQWAHRDLDKIASDHIPAAWYGTAATYASAALSAVAGTADRVSAALSPAAAALHTLQQQVQDAAAKDANGMDDLRAARDGLQVELDMIAIAVNHGVTVMDVDVHVRPWYQKAQQAVQTRLDAANEAATAATTAGGVFDQQAAAIRAPGLFPDLSTAVATSAPQFGIARFANEQNPAVALLSAAGEVPGVDTDVKTIVLVGHIPGDPTEHRLLVNVEHDPAYGIDDRDPDAHIVFKLYDLGTGQVTSVPANAALSGQPVTTSGGALEVSGVWIGQ